MDSLTQIILGASVAEFHLGKKVGNKAALWGAIVGTIPDLDVLGKFWQNEYVALLSHRGFSHSILVSILAAPVLGYLIHRLYKGKVGTVKSWSFLCFWVWFTHILLDSFTNWGTQLFWPFSNMRVAFNNIFVADPIYTVPFMLLLLIALFLKKDGNWRRILNGTALTISTLYMLLTLVNKATVAKVFENSLHKQAIGTTRISTYPTPLNNLLWYGIAESHDDFWVGNYSLMDKDMDIKFRRIPKNHQLLPEAGNEEFFDGLKWVSKGFYTLENANDTLVWNDIRFGFSGLSDSAPPNFTFKLLERNGAYYDIRQKQPELSDAKKGLGEIWDRMWGKE